MRAVRNICSNVEAPISLWCCCWIAARRVLLLLQKCNESDAKHLIQRGPAVAQNTMMNLPRNKHVSSWWWCYESLTSRKQKLQFYVDTLFSKHVACVEFVLFSLFALLPGPLVLFSSVIGGSVSPNGLSNLSECTVPERDSIEDTETGPVSPLALAS